MPQSLAQIHLHLIFSTKNREPYLRDPEVRDRTFRYLAGVCNNHDSHAYRVGGVADHVHIHCRLSRTISVADLVRELKRASSIWLHNSGIDPFAWQVGYGAFSVGASQVESLNNYIDNQESHHTKTTFQDEFRAFLHRYGIEFDERYVWD